MTHLTMPRAVIVLLIILLVSAVVAGGCASNPAQSGAETDINSPLKTPNNESDEPPDVTQEPVTVPNPNTPTEDGPVETPETGPSAPPWRLRFGSAISAALIHADGVLYIGSENGYIDAVDAMSGEHLWRFRSGGAISNAPIVHDGRVFVGSDDGRVYALDAANGDRLWHHQAQESPSLSEVVQNSLYVDYESHQDRLRQDELEVTTGILIRTWSLSERILRFAQGTGYRFRDRLIVSLDPDTREEN